MKLDLCLTPNTKINWKWITDINTSNCKYLEENIGEGCLTLELHNDFWLDITQKAQGTKAKTGKWDYIKL